MQGMLFVMLNKDGQAVNHGLIAQAITPEKYLCQFAIPTPSSRVVTIEELQSYTLFNDVNQQKAFMDVIQKNKLLHQASKPPASKKKVTKKKVRKSK